MASHEHSTPLPCAFCGHGEPSESKSHGICELCARTLDLSDNVRLVQLPDLPRRVVLIPVTSNNLAAAGWRNVDGKVGVLLLQFKGNAKLHRYANVSRAWWQAFWKAPSKGSFFHTTVRADVAAHPFTTLEEQQ